MIGRLGDLRMGEKMLRLTQKFLMRPLSLNQLCLLLMLSHQEIAEMFTLLGCEHTQDLFFKLKTQPKLFHIQWLENFS